MTAAPRIANGGSQRATVAIIAIAALAGCARARPIHDGSTVRVPAGSFVMGSNRTERANAVELSVRAGTYGVGTTQALRAELPSHAVHVDRFAIMTRPVTNAAYYAFVVATGAPEPFIDSTTWSTLGTGYAYAMVSSVLWQGGAPTVERAEHPVVLLTRRAARDYCAWWGSPRPGSGRLPTEAQWEKAARGVDGRTFPWGNHFSPGLVNSAESKRGASTPAGGRVSASSPYGALDMAGNVFEWTRTPWSSAGGAVVKGGAFNVDALSARAAARHSRSPGLQHPAIGFRCVLLPDA